MVIEYAVDVVWPGNHCRGMLQYPPEGGSSLGGPVLVMGGKPYEAPVLPKGCRVLVVWREARTGPVWELIHRAMTTGQFPIEILEDERDEDTYRLMAEITLLRSQLAQKDTQISELKALFARTQPRQPGDSGKKRWWMFWQR